ncbi:MAG: LamG-like jellyroll fold domain-containing protein [Cellulomonas sp.]
MASSANLRRSTAPRLALVAVAVLTASTFLAGPETTAAMLTGTATTTSSITTRAACLDGAGEQAPENAYTSGLLNLTSPALRWSFSGGHLPVAVATDGTLTPVTVARGLLQCDPADFPGVPEAEAIPGALQLTQGGTTGLAVASQPLTESFTLLLWVSRDATSEGELASLGRTDDELALGLSGSTVSLAFPVEGGTSVVSLDAVDAGRAHLVGVVYDAGTLTLSVDGAREAEAGQQTTWTPAGTPNALTIGARAAHPSAGALVDEVTLLTGPATRSWLTSLVTSDRWWLTAGWTFSGPAAPHATALAASMPATVLVPEPPAATPAGDPSSAPAATPDPPAAVEVLPPVVVPTADPQTTDDRRSRSTTSRHKPSR